MGRYFIWSNPDFSNWDVCECHLRSLPVYIKILRMFCLFLHSSLVWPDCKDVEVTKPPCLGHSLEQFASFLFILFSQPNPFPLTQEIRSLGTWHAPNTPHAFLLLGSLLCSFYPFPLLRGFDWQLPLLQLYHGEPYVTMFSRGGSQIKTWSATWSYCFPCPSRPYPGHP